MVDRCFSDKFGINPRDGFWENGLYRNDDGLAPMLHIYQQLWCAVAGTNLSKAKNCLSQDKIRVHIHQY